MTHKDTQILTKILEEIAALNSFTEHLSEQEFYNSEVIRRAAHKYQTLHIEDVWATVSNDIPSLQNKIRYILKNPI